MTEEKNTDSLFTDNPDRYTTIDEWADIKLIHRSERGLCDVYSATRNGRRVALKALRPEYRRDNRYATLLRKEYDVVSMLHHQGIVSAIDFTEVPSLGQAMVMEHVGGTTLSEYLRSNPSPSPDTARDIITRLCDAVSYMHSRQIIHRDLKPSNIMIIPDGGYIRVIDFGLCRAEGFERFDISGGTEGFSAPEAFSADTPAGPQADIYSIGKIIELLLPQPEPHIARLIRQCTAANPDDRPRHVDEIAHTLRQKPSRKRRIVLTAAAILLLAVGIAVMGLLRGTDAPADEFAATTSEAVAATPLDSIPAANSTDTPTAGTGIPDETTEPAATDLSKEKIAETDRGSTETIDNNPADVSDANLPFDERLYRVTLRAAEKRFAEHIALIDTMTTSRSSELAMINHWRWLAKQDVRRWLEGQMSADNPRIDTLMDDVAKTVVAFGEREENEIMQSEHLQAAAKRDVSLVGAATAITYRVSDDRICREELNEDGTWTRTVSSTIPHPTPDSPF